MSTTPARALEYLRKLSEKQVNILFDDVELRDAIQANEILEILSIAHEINNKTLTSDSNVSKILSTGRAMQGNKDKFKNLIPDLQTIQLANPNNKDIDIVISIINNL